MEWLRISIIFAGLAMIIGPILGWLLDKHYAKTKPILPRNGQTGKAPVSEAPLAR